MFSKDGSFTEDSNLVVIHGIFYDTGLPKGRCYSLLVRYRGTERLCFETVYFSIPNLSWRCDGWEQSTLTFSMIALTPDWASVISRQEVSQHQQQ